MEWNTLLAYITGTVDQELLLRNEYLVAENRILRKQITGRVRLNDGERTTLAALGKRLGNKALAEVTCPLKTDPKSMREQQSNFEKGVWPQKIHLI